MASYIATLRDAVRDWLNDDEREFVLPFTAESRDHPNTEGATLRPGVVKVYVIPRNHDATPTDRGGTRRHEIRIDVGIIARVDEAEVVSGLPTLASDQLKELYEQIGDAFPVGRFGATGCSFVGTDNAGNSLYDPAKLLSEATFLSVNTLRFIRIH